ncbi:sulfur carrier protein ThiS [Niallia sp. Krafla_26]|uniref:sulfur carrier protein ThiS n=1 Tax=Niallia sp. Krafla_26 TaxID=3064703 RepID=UPI003D16C33D
MKVNGTLESLEKEITLYNYLTSKGFDLAKIAVEQNGQIVPKKEYQNIYLEDQDTLEIVQFVGGG